MRHCPRCGAEVEDGAVFCPSCGSYLGICPCCGTVVPKEQLSQTGLCPKYGQELRPVLVSKPAGGAKWRISDVLKVLGVLVAVQVILAMLPSVGLLVALPWIVVYNGYIDQNMSNIISFLLFVKKVFAHP